MIFTTSCGFLAVYTVYLLWRGLWCAKLGESTERAHRIVHAAASCSVLVISLARIVVRCVLYAQLTEPGWWLTLGDTCAAFSACAFGMEHAYWFPDGWSFEEEAAAPAGLEPSDPPPLAQPFTLLDPDSDAARRVTCVICLEHLWPDMRPQSCASRQHLFCGACFDQIPDDRCPCRCGPLLAQAPVAGADTVAQLVEQLNAQIRVRCTQCGAEQTLAGGSSSSRVVLVCHCRAAACAQA